MAGTAVTVVVDWMIVVVRILMEVHRLVGEQATEWVLQAVVLRR
jgi:hypothetical protein